MTWMQQKNVHTSCLSNSILTNPLVDMDAAFQSWQCRNHTIISNIHRQHTFHITTSLTGLCMEEDAAKLCSLVGMVTTTIQSDEDNGTMSGRL